MKIYNIQYKVNQELCVQQVKAKDLEHAKQLVMFKNALRPNQILPDEALL